MREAELHHQITDEIRCQMIPRNSPGRSILKCLGSKLPLPHLFHSPSTQSLQDLGDGYLFHCPGRQRDRNVKIWAFHLHKERIYRSFHIKADSLCCECKKILLQTVIQCAYFLIKVEQAMISSVAVLTSIFDDICISCRSSFIQSFRSMCA